MLSKSLSNSMIKVWAPALLLIVSSSGVEGGAMLSERKIGEDSLYCELGLLA